MTRDDVDMIHKNEIFHMQKMDKWYKHINIVHTPCNIFNSYAKQNVYIKNLCIFSKFSIFYEFELTQMEKYMYENSKILPIVEKFVDCL